MSRDEEIHCIQHVLAGDREAESAGKRLVEAKLRLVVSIAEKYRSDRIHILDLIQKGNDGLLSALESLGDSAEDSFSAYATPHVERAITEGLACSDSINAIQPAQENLVNGGFEVSIKGPIQVFPALGRFGIPST